MGFNKKFYRSLLNPYTQRRLLFFGGGTFFHVGVYSKPELEFVNLLRSPGIDSQPGRPIRKPYLTYRPARLHRLAESIPGLLTRLQIRALRSFDLSQPWVAPIIQTVSLSYVYYNTDEWMLLVRKSSLSFTCNGYRENSSSQIIQLFNIF